MAVGDLAVAAYHIGLRHAIDAPVDGDAARAVGADPGERVAVAAEEAPRRRAIVLVVDAVKANAWLLGKLEQQGMLFVTGHAPRGPHIDDGGLALGEIGGLESLRTFAGEPLDRRQSEGRHGLAHER